jgi:hypothetical protein
MVRRILLGLVAALVVIVTTIRVARMPSSNRGWTPQQRVAPAAVVRGNLVEIRGIRDFTHRTEADFDERYATRTFDLGKLRAADYVVSRFGGVPGLAHAFLSFDFGGEHIAVSVEARKERGETYSPLLGLLNTYEILYVIGTERDLIGLRTHVWKENVTLYPVRARPERLRQVFLDMVARADSLRTRPEFYDTLFNSCNSNIVRHVNAIAPGRIRFDARTILPGFSDEVAYELGLIDSTLPLERVREAYRIDEVARTVPLDENFSRAIRARLPRREVALIPHITAHRPPL